MTSSLFELGLWQIAFWWVAWTAAAAAVWLLWSGQHRDQFADRAAAWWAWHWFTGGPLEGQRAIVGLDDDRSRAARAGRRAALAAARTLPVAAVAAAEYVRAAAPWGAGARTVAAAGFGVPVALAVVSLAVVHAAVRAAHHLQWVRPLHRAVCAPAGWDEETKPARYLVVPRNRAAGAEGVIVAVAPDFRYTDTKKAELVTIVKAKLALSDVAVTWVPDGRHGYVQFRPNEQMPTSAKFSDPAIRELVEKAKASAPLIGVSKGNKPVAVDLDVEAPHVLISAGTGGGKSTMIRTLAAQLMARGADSVVLDYKRHSHGWLRGLPGVTYARDIEEIHNQLVRLAKEGHRRNRALDDIDAADAPRPKRLVVVCEELNATMAMLKMHWRDIRESGDPVTSPAITALGQLLFMGRAVRIHVLAVAQLATAKDLGGPEMREQFAVRVLARYTGNAAKMLVPECNLPATSRHPGRAQVCIGGTATDTQVAFLSDDEARALVLGQRGDSVEDVADVACRETPDSQGKQGVTVADGPEPVALDGVRPITLATASADRGRAVVALSYDALRQAKRRDPEFPEPAGKRGNAGVWRPADLQRWELNRPSAQPSVTNVTPLPAAADERNEVDEVDQMEATTGA